MIVTGHMPLLGQQATHRDGTARTVNPSAKAYTGSNPVPATLFEGCFRLSGVFK